MTNEKRIAAEKAIVRRYLTALKEAGYTFRWSYDGDTFERSALVETVIEAIYAVDELNVVCMHETNKYSFVFFVLGNAPDEVLCDYGVSLEPYVGPVLESLV